MISFSTAGVKVKYAVETTAGTRPTTGYTEIQGITSTPDFGMEPNMLDSTPLSATEYKEFTKGLKDPSSANAYGLNLNDAVMTAWDTMCSAASTAIAAGKKCWFEISHPKLAKSFFFAGDPAPLGLSGMEVDNVLQTQAYIVPTEVVGWATAST